MLPLRHSSIGCLYEVPMTSTVRLEIDDHCWSTFVQQCPCATAFHHPAWADLLAKCYGCRAFALTMMDDARGILAGLPVMEIGRRQKGRRWVSLPFTDYCYPLLRDDVKSEIFADALFAQWQRNQLSTLEVRAALAAKSGIYADTRYVIHTLSLDPTPETVFAKFSKKFRQYPRKAEREGLHVVSTGTKQDLEAFYAIHLKTRVKLGVPIQPKRFFKLLWEHMISQGLGKIIIVADEHNRPISGAVLLYYKTSAMIKYSASDPSHLATRCHYFTFWKCVEWACLNGMSVIDFGKTDTQEEGLRDFKSGWGAREEALVYSVVAGRPPRPANGRLSRWLSGVIRHSPSLVCRVLGELFYRYAA
jgi:CelD/BcsL family acetyltransferase involved in cellulose biosynthesis